jgi:adenylate kinase
MRLVFLGPPGAGKGTQAVRISERHRIPHISTGDILRSAVESGTELGNLARRFMSEGQLVPDEVMVGIIKDRLSKEDVAQRGFILDGFPRTVVQARALDEILTELSMPLDRVVYLNVDDEEVVKRLLLRKRADDTEEVIRKRLQVYREMTEPLVNYYAERSLLVEIFGVGDIDEITRRIEEKLGLNG